MTQWGLDTLFNPAKRHMDEEKRRLQSTRAEQGDSSGGKRIDLESGKVRIRRDDAADSDSADAAFNRADADQAGHAESTSANPTARHAHGTTGAPSAAAVRAAARRGRTPR